MAAARGAGDAPCIRRSATGVSGTRYTTTLPAACSGASSPAESPITPPNTTGAASCRADW